MIRKLTFRVVVLFITAIARFRFPRGESLPTVIRRRYGNDVLKLVRKYERTERKTRKAELDHSFLEKCVELSLTPKFLNFKVTNENLRNSSAYATSQENLLHTEIGHKRDSIDQLRVQLESIKEELQSKMNCIDYSHVISCFLQSNDEFIQEHTIIQDKKLCKLISNSDSYQIDPSKVIHNFSNYELSDLEKSILVKGVNYSVNPGKLLYGDYCLNFELLFSDISRNAKLTPHNLDIVKSKLKDVSISSFEGHNLNPDKFSNLNEEERDCLRHLSDNKDLVIQKSDKGNAVVILNKTDYCDRVRTILNDTSKFQIAKIKDGKLLRYLTNIRKSFKLVLDKLVEKGKISKEQFHKVDPIGHKPGVLYGLSKVHKSLVGGIPKIRPILSAIGTAGYGLSKFLVPILDKIAKGPYTIHNSFSFNQEVLKQDPSLIMGSLDVDALFTNIPLDETIDICISELYKNDDLVKKLDKKEMKDLLQLACKDNLFLFDGSYYNQIDGVAMGSPLGPHLANTFMNFHEKIWLEKCPLEFKPKYYRRYVDDIFVLFESVEKMKKFESYLNSQHENIRFTSEFESDGKLPFLDMLVDRNNGMSTSVYRKPTFTGIYTHFTSFLPSVYKMGLLSTILFRYYSLCSSYTSFHKEILNFKMIFLKNGYAANYIDTCIKRFLNKIFIKKTLVDTEPTKEYMIVLPYLGPLSDKIQKRIRNIFKLYIPNGIIKLVWKTDRRLSSFLKFKDVVDLSFDSHVVYNFKCSSCKGEYIGETRTHFKTRCSQHLGISEFTGKPTTAGVPTFVTKHIKENNCLCTLDNFVIIDRETDYHRRLIKESLYIKLYNPIINGKSLSTKLYLY